MTPFDEFFLGENEPRPHQKLISDFLQEHTPEAREKTARLLQTRLLEQEVSYNILGEPGGSPRPWNVDAVPHVIPGPEFDDLSHRLRQRVRLLNACLADFYGEQRLIRDGFVPAEITLGNPHFFRTLHGTVPPGGAHLTLYAADLVRTPDGGYVVHSDRTAAPTGSGYALENRLGLGQVLGKSFRENRVRKINRFFAGLKETLSALSPSGRSTPRVVLLTPGVHDESSFEHGFLARYQGFELVEGRDLTVRGEEVFLKTLEGLKKVDVILRRLHDDWCDPLQLREDSLLGVSGLVGAAQSGNVVVANALGSGLIESPAFRAYLPALCREVLGEELKLPSIETRYLGDRAHRDEVLGSIENWIIRPAFNDRKAPARRVGELSTDARTALISQLEQTPGRFVAEQWPTPSEVPLGLDLAQRGALTLRLFARRSGQDFAVMPGGLGRVNDTPDGLFLIPGSAPVGKDVWIAGPDDADEPTLPRMPEPELSIRRGGIDLPSRLFDDLFWLGRYVQRANDSARLLRTSMEFLLDDDSEIPDEVAKVLPSTLAALQITTPGLNVNKPLEDLLVGCTYDLSRPNSVASNLGRVNSLTTATRSRLSTSMWGALRRATGPFVRSPRKSNLHDAAEELDGLLLNLAAFHGVTSSNMVRGHAWIFLELGRRIERAVFVFVLMQHVFADGTSRTLMDYLLKICDSLLTYRSRYLSNLQSTPVADLVLTDDTNPQSALFQVRHMLNCLRALPKESPFPLSRAEQRLLVLETSLVTADLAKACRSGAAELGALAEEGVNLLWQVSDDLNQTYFTHAHQSHSIASSHWIDARLEVDQ